MNTLQAGYSKVNVNPMLGIPINGYFKPRYAEGILDDLEIVAVALACGDTKTLLMAIDNLHINTNLLKVYQEKISEKTGVAKEAIFIHSTHTHTAGTLELNSKNATPTAFSVNNKFTSFTLPTSPLSRRARAWWARQSRAPPATARMSSIVIGKPSSFSFLSEYTTRYSRASRIFSLASAMAGESGSIK